MDFIVVDIFRGWPIMKSSVLNYSGVLLSLLVEILGETCAQEIKAL